MAPTITLRLDGVQIPARVFHQKTGAFLAVLHEVERSLMEGRGASGSASITWMIESIRAGSPIVMTLRAASPAKPATENVGAQVVMATMTGLKALESEDRLGTPPPAFTMSVLEHVERLICPLGDVVAEIAISAREQTVTLSEQAVRNLARFLRPASRYDGSVEGVLELAPVGGGAPRFGLRDRLTGRLIRCTVPPVLLDEVLRLLGRRVTVFGRVHTNAPGDVLRIEMDRLEMFPPERDLPSVEHVAGAFDLTGDKTVEEHLERLRDAS